MRILGIDYGLSRIGLAVSDPGLVMAMPHSVLHRKSDEDAVRQIAALIQDLDVSRVVVGLPKNMNGTQGAHAERSVDFAERLRAETGLVVDLYDERLTTVSAERLLISADVRRKGRKQVIDAVAASILLQGFLDRLRTLNRENQT